MAEELFHGGVCGGGANWWNNSTRNMYSSSSLCSSLANRDLTTKNMKSTTRSSDADSASDGSCSSTVIIQDVLKPNQQTLQMVGISPDDHWINNQDLLHNNNGRSEQNYSNILDSSMNYWQENDWISATSNLISQDSNSVINSLNQTFDQLNSSNGFPLMNSASYSSYDSSLLQTLFDDTDSNPLRTQQSLLDNREFNYSSSAENYQVNLNEFLPMENPSFVKQQQLWNSTSADLSTNARSSFLPSSSQSQFLPSSLHCKKPNLPSFSVKNQNEEASVPKKESNEPSFKRPRIETPSPLPTFKVRKEKLGDRITALQQLVSPFGKTDTASVLHEAIEYIKFLHDQVNELSSPYLKHRPAPVQRLQAEDKEGVMQDLKTRGLCLVPVTSTFPVAQTPADFWTPTFGGSFK